MELSEGAHIYAMCYIAYFRLIECSCSQEAPMHRLLLPVKVSCLALSKTGTYLVCGTHDGRLFLWEVRQITYNDESSYKSC